VNTTRADTSMFLMGAGACLLIGGILAFIASRKRYVVEF
jgi:hypothetical protein